jgi:predicted transcriptional regulator
MEKGESPLKGHGAKIAMGIMFCILVFLAGMMFSINNRLTDFQASTEKRISRLEERQHSIEESLGILKDIQPELEGAHRHWEALKEKMTVLQGAVEKLVDEFSESLSEEQKEKMKKAFNKLFRLWEIFGEFVEELGAENRGTKGGGQEGEGSKN